MGTCLTSRCSRQGQPHRRGNPTPAVGDVERGAEWAVAADVGCLVDRVDIARLIGGSEARAIKAHYDSDPEFQQSVNRYVHDFESMLRRVLAERDGGMIAVTLMSSDMGKLYAALASALERRR